MPDWFSWEFWAKDSESLYHLALIVAGAIGIPLLYIRTRAADRSADAALEQAKAALKQSETAAERHKQQTDADRERRITETFAKAIEQLGDDKLEVRLGGIYTLERIARESERDYWPIMETLTAYVRERAPWPPKSSAADETAGESASSPENEAELASRIRPATDIQAVLTVLGRHNETMRQRDQAAGRRLDLRRTDLRDANLAVAYLERAVFEGAHMEGASLVGAYLESALLTGAHMEGAHFGGACLKRAVLTGTHLEGANLEVAKNLTQGQVNAAMGDDRTRLPEGLTRPANWPKAEADDEGDSER